MESKCLNILEHLERFIYFYWNFLFYLLSDHSLFKFLTNQIAIVHEPVNKCTSFYFSFKKHVRQGLLPKIFPTVKISFHHCLSGLSHNVVVMLKLSTSALHLVVQKYCAEWSIDKALAFSFSGNWKSYRFMLDSWWYYNENVTCRHFDNFFM